MIKLIKNLGLDDRIVDMTKLDSVNSPIGRVDPIPPPGEGGDILVAPVLDPYIDEEADLEGSADETEESMYRILLHNDPITTFVYVIKLLMKVFKLSQEMAEHVAETAHMQGTAIVMVRPKAQAEKLVKIANAKARLDGFPLTFTMEED
ncbi:MAG: ATP-dependent Clp protease adaptor ClpS [Chloroflexota bacterium]